MKSSDGLRLGIVLALCLTTAGVSAGLWVGNKHLADVARTRRDAVSQRWLAEGALLVRQVAELPGTDPGEPIWAEAPVFDALARPQVVTMPALEDTSTQVVRVQALTDGEQIAWRLTWEDSTPDTAVDAARFTDAAALQFPVVREASFMMGAKDQRVQILHWKGVWQRDVEDGFQDVQDLHPNYWADLYWFAQGDSLARVPDSFEDPASHQWFAGKTAGNPVSQWDRAEPVEELSAEGFGTLTSQPASATRGSADWADGRWSVVFLRPLRTDDADDYQFTSGMTGTVAIAIWEGSAENVGGRKRYSEWIEFRLEPIS